MFQSVFLLFITIDSIISKLTYSFILSKSGEFQFNSLLNTQTLNPKGQKQQYELGETLRRNYSQLLKNHSIIGQSVAHSQNVQSLQNLLAGITQQPQNPIFIDVDPQNYFFQINQCYNFYKILQQRKTDNQYLQLSKDEIFLRRLYVQFGTYEQNQIMSSYIFKLLSDKLNNKNKNEQIGIYAVLDCQFVSLMVSLNITSYDCLYAKKYSEPQQQQQQYCSDETPFGSVIVFELHNINKSEYVKTILNGQPLDICKNDAQMCTLDQFNNITSNYIVSDQQYSDLCNDRSFQGIFSKNNRVYFNVIFSLSSLSIFLIILTVFLSIKCYKMKRKMRNLNCEFRYSIQDSSIKENYNCPLIRQQQQQENYNCPLVRQT